MENQQVLDVISNLKGRKNYEEKKSKKLGFNSLYEYIEDKLAKKAETEKIAKQNSENLKFIVIGLILCVIIYYLKDLSLALGKTDRIPLILSIWTPIIALSFFTLIGVIQINEK